jgi:diadenosine tetraphosphate (Ap4A) HIT family hydrolase
MSDFELHPRLAADTAFIADWPLCRALVMNDARYPWLVLVPRRANAIEIHDLDAEDRAALTEEIAQACNGLKSFTGAAKINMGALGNLVTQLHIHVVARNPGDAAWPGPVWGNGAAIPYAPDALKAFVKAIGTAIAP